MSFLIYFKKFETVFLKNFMSFLTIHRLASFSSDGGIQTLVHEAKDQLLGILFFKIILFIFLLKSSLTGRYSG